MTPTVAETQLRQLHQLWPYFTWGMHRERRNLYTVTRRLGEGSRVYFFARTAGEAIQRAHCETLLAYSIGTPESRRAA